MSYLPLQAASSSTPEWPQSLISQFPAPPTTNPQPQQSYAAPMIISLGEEYTDATLPAASSSTSSGPSSSMHSYLQLEDEDEEEYGDYDESTDDETSDSDSDDDYTPTSPETSPSANAHFHRRRRSQSMNNIFPSALWHAEHARLIRIQNAVMDSERAARTRELKLESEVARIKEDLAKLKQARATASVPSSKNAVSTSPTRPLHPAGPRGPRPRPTSASSTQSSGSTAAAQRGSVCTQLASIPSVRSTSGDIGARDDQDIAGEEDEATTVLSHHLTQARSARAQERQRRRLEHERMRELNMLLTLGSEVRKWEERLAWSSMAMSRAATSSDDIHLSNDSSTANTDTDPDPRGKRLSRSFSLPSSRASHHHGHPATINGSRSGTSTPVSPALPSLSLSPLWRVSAEMILRRRSLSERPRRTTNPQQQQQQQQQMNGAKRMCVSTFEQTCVPSTLSTVQAPVPVSTPARPQSTTASSTLSRPNHVLRGPRERSTQIGVSSTAITSSRLMTATTATALTTDSETLTSSPVPGMSTSAATSSLSVSITDGTSSGPISPSSGKRYSVPPPITIPSNAQFCTSTAVSSNSVEGGPKVAIVRAPRPVHPSACVTPARSTTPIKPSALKWAYTADDLAREREMEEMAKAKEAQLAKMLSTSCSESESDDSKSGSDGSSAASSSASSSQEEACETSQQRRGRARFSWRKSLPKDSNNASSSTPAVPTVPLSVDA